MTARPIAMVTGATRRVGLAIARAMARSGFDLVLTYNTGSGRLAEVRDELEPLGAGVVFEHLDLTDLGASESLAARLAEDLPRLDVLVHNASAYVPTPLAQTTAASVESLMRVHAIAPLLITKHLAPRLAQSALPGGGAIVAMGDIHALGRPRRDFAAYAMSKAALVEMVRSLARDLAPRVRVNGIAPGVVAFPDEGHESDPAAQEAYLRKVPLERSGTPDDAAEVVRWLALDAHYVTGEIVRVDGGRWLTP
ncbi:MAG: SDR family oxidoreductase [Phycisphaerales bacterium]|jgi:pteridine reductase|nr:SDR family oxidoreductase [Phycisphaerales bacterium]